MADSKDPQSSTLKWFAGGAVLFLAALFFALNGGSGPKSGTDGDGNQQAAVGMSAQDDSSEAGDSTQPGRTKGATDRSTKADPTKGPRFPLVDAVLEDESLDNHQSALKLRDIVMTEAAPENERLEAIAHGLNLDFMAFKGIARDARLPESVAERYLTELTNQNDFRPEQIDGLMDLLGHPSEGVRGEAADKLAFLIENEELASSPARLKEAAGGFLQKLRAAAEVPAQSPSQEAPPADSQPAPAGEDG